MNSYNHNHTVYYFCCAITIECFFSRALLINIFGRAIFTIFKVCKTDFDQLIVRILKFCLLRIVPLGNVFDYFKFYSNLTSG